MKSSSRFVLAAIGLVLAAVAAWILISMPRGRDGRASRIRSEDEIHSAATAGDVAAVGDETVERNEPVRGDELDDQAALCLLLIDAHTRAPLLESTAVTIQASSGPLEWFRREHALVVPGAETGLLQVRADGYLPKPIRVADPDDAEDWWSAPMEVLLTPLRALTVQVGDSRGSPIEGAVVRCKLMYGAVLVTADVTTDASGSAHPDAIEIGMKGERVVIGVEHEGYGAREWDFRTERLYDSAVLKLVLEEPVEIRAETVPLQHFTPGTVTLKGSSAANRGRPVPGGVRPLVNGTATFFPVQPLPVNATLELEGETLFAYVPKQEGRSWTLRFYVGRFPSIEPRVPTPRQLARDHFSFRIRAEATLPAVADTGVMAAQLLVANAVSRSGRWMAVGAWQRLPGAAVAGGGCVEWDATVSLETFRKQPPHSVNVAIHDGAGRSAVFFGIEVPFDGAVIDLGAVQLLRGVPVLVVVRNFPPEVRGRLDLAVVPSWAGLSPDWSSRVGVEPGGNVLFADLGYGIHYAVGILDGRPVCYREFLCERRDDASEQVVELDYQQAAQLTLRWAEDFPAPARLEISSTLLSPPPIPVLFAEEAGQLEATAVIPPGTYLASLACFIGEYTTRSVWSTYVTLAPGEHRTILVGDPREPVIRGKCLPREGVPPAAVIRAEIPWTPGDPAPDSAQTMAERSGASVLSNLRAQGYRIDVWDVAGTARVADDYVWLLDAGRMEGSFVIPEIVDHK